MVEMLNRYATKVINVPETVCNRYNLIFIIFYFNFKIKKKVFFITSKSYVSVNTSVFVILLISINFNTYILTPVTAHKHVCRYRPTILVYHFGCLYYYELWTSVHKIQVHVRFKSFLDGRGERPGYGAGPVGIENGILGGESLAFVGNTIYTRTYTPIYLHIIIVRRRSDPPELGGEIKKQYKKIIIIINPGTTLRRRALRGGMSSRSRGGGTAAGRRPRRAASVYPTSGVRDQSGYRAASVTTVAVTARLSPCSPPTVARRRGRLRCAPPPP